MEEIYKDESMCAECKGACCKAVGCIYSIRQFLDERTGVLNTKEIKKILKQGNVFIDCRSAC